MNSTWWVKPEELDEDQRTVVALDRKASHLVLGPPGSGKTNLLLLRAKHQQYVGEVDFEVLVFTRTLQEFLRGGAKAYRIDPKRIRTSRSWFLSLIEEHDKKLEPEGTFDEQRELIADTLERVIKKRGLKQQVGTILLDEAQDYTPREIGIFRHLAKHIFAVGDIHQKIYDGDSPIEALTALTGKPKTLQLHYRSGQPICDLADAVAPRDADFSPISGSCNYKEKVFGKSAVTREKCPDLAEQAKRAISRLATQLKAFQGDLLGVLCPTNDAAREVWAAIQKSELAKYGVYQSQRDGYTAFSPNHRVCVSTVHSAKGLEFRAVHFLAAETAQYFRQRTRSTYYTAITRARTALGIYHAGSLPPYLEKAIQALDGRKPEPTLAELFGKGDA